MIVHLLTSALLLIAAILPVGANAAGCQDVQILGVRGSGQTGYGEQVGEVVSNLVEDIGASGRSVAAEALEYPAISISDSFGLVLLTGDYDRSVAAGIERLRSAVDGVTEACSDTQIVLIGYSQGAQVIKQTMENTVPNARIASVVLLADPTRDPSQSGITRLGDSQNERGGSFGAIALPGYLRTVAVDVCVDSDGICERGVFGFFAHTDGYTEFSEIVATRVMRSISAHIHGGLRFL
ncbi:MAG: cutinase family protein [Actinomycetia bacterium]|nr:cutinase family protein [Actinomycetes bacterium]